jgi:hypothetical protein
MMTDGVKGSRIAGSGPNEAFYTVDHLLRRGAAEGEKENPTGIHAKFFYEIGNPCSDGRGFSGSRGSQNALVFGGGARYDTILLFIQGNGSMGEF